MNKYSVNNVSKITNVSIHTLRYYDKIGILSPKRSDNNYRYYTENDILDLKYIQVMKYAGLSLDEIKIILQNKSATNDYDENLNNTLLILENKKSGLIKKIEDFNYIVKMLEISQTSLINKEIGDKSEVNKLILSIYESIMN